MKIGIAALSKRLEISPITSLRLLDDMYAKTFPKQMLK